MLIPWVAGAAMLVFAGASFFFALAESALFSLGKWRAQRLAESAGFRGKAVAELLKNPHDVLAAIVLGNTFANAGVVALGLWFGLRGGTPVALTLAGALLLVLFGCEVIPKTLAVRSPEQWCLRLAIPMSYLQWVTGPLREIAQRMNRLILLGAIPKNIQPQSGLTEDEYQELLEMAYLQGALGQSEKEIILQIINLDRRAVREVMKPRAQMLCISDELTLEEMIAAARQYKVRRIPIYDENPDTIVGILNLRTLLLDPGRDLSIAVEFPSFVPETMNLLQLLKSLQRRKRGLAIVLDEFGGTAGVVTIEDILEEVVGALHSESEPEPVLMERLGEGRWKIQGSMRLDDFRRECPEVPEIPEVETMAGLLITQLGIVPEEGDSVHLGGVRLTARIVDERRVHEILVENLKNRRTS